MYIHIYTHTNMSCDMCVAMLLDFPSYIALCVLITEGLAGITANVGQPHTTWSQHMAWDSISQSWRLVGIPPLRVAQEDQRIYWQSMQQYIATNCNNECTPSLRSSRYKHGWVVKQFISETWGPRLDINTWHSISKWNSKIYFKIIQEHYFNIHTHTHKNVCVWVSVERGSCN